ncbi:MAG: arginine--tRNA ligase, partial [bacterium]|nr:arginine--tRNA ligase [bacterium]
HDVDGIGIRFDNWVSESEILSHGKTKAVIERLRKAGVVQKKEGAEWFVPSPVAGAEALEDRESVLVRSTGEPTYFANDIAYHVDKFERGYDHLIDIWGANHHAHIFRIRAALVALGYRPEQFEVILYQYVRVKRGDEAVKMSKRAGDFVTAREVLDEVGKDAFRFFLLARSASSHLDFDLDLAKKQSSENPVYYIQYAHARICSLLEKGREKGVVVDSLKVDLTKINLPEEIELIRSLHDFPFELQTAILNREPNRIPYYLVELARFLQFYYSRAKEDSRYHILSQPIDTAAAKLYLLRHVRDVLREGLSLLGVSAPERMQSLEESKDE